MSIAMVITVAEVGQRCLMLSKAHILSIEDGSASQLDLQSGIHTTFRHEKRNKYSLKTIPKIRSGFYFL